MTIRAIVKMGNPILAKSSLAVSEFNTKELMQIIQDMQDTMEHLGGVGIAAPQIGYNLRIVIFGFDYSERYQDEDKVPYTVLINPIIKFLTEETEDGWEGCLSVPGLRGLVPRYKKIEYSGFDEQGNYFIRIAENFHARVVQHECDHIDGMLYPQRIKDLHYFGFEDELVKIL